MNTERFILKRLIRKRVIGAKHTALRDAIKSLPKHELKTAKKTVRKLFNEEILLPKQTSYGLHISINPTKLDEVYRRIR